MTSPSEIPQPQSRVPQPEISPIECLSQPSLRLLAWRLWVPLAFQVALIVAVPARDAHTYVSGRTVTLQTVPVDPYDLLRGYSQTLQYDISTLDKLKKLPGGSWFIEQAQGQTTTFYLVLEAPAQTNVTPPKPWQPVRVSGNRPSDLTANQALLQGEFDGQNIIYGLETYYIPEDQRQQINTEIDATQRQNSFTSPLSPSPASVPNQQAFVVDIKVDAVGNAVPVSLWLRDRNYQF